MKKVILASLAIVASGIAAAACSGGGGGGTTTYTLEDGTYNYRTATVSNDTCWPESESVPPVVGINLPFLITVNSETSFTLTGSGISAGLVPPINGTKTGNDILATGSMTIALTNTCSVNIMATADGVMVADAEFDADIDLTLDVATLNTMGTASNCSGLTSADFGGILTPPATIKSNGTCGLTLSGTGTLAP